MSEIRIENNGASHTIGQPLCGWSWLNDHLYDHTHAEVEALTIEVFHGDRLFATVRGDHKKGIIKNLVNLRKGG